MKVLHIIIRQFSSKYLETLFKALIFLDAFVHISGISDMSIKFQFIVQSNP